MKAALYMRVSKSDGSQTVENQRRDLLAYAERMGYEVIEFVTTKPAAEATVTACVHCWKHAAEGKCPAC